MSLDYSIGQQVAGELQDLPNIAGLSRLGQMFAVQYDVPTQ